MECDPQIFGRDIVAPPPVLAFEPFALLSESGGELLHDARDQAVGILDRAARLVDEARLDLLPAALEACAQFVGGSAAGSVSRIDGIDGASTVVAVSGWCDARGPSTRDLGSSARSREARSRVVNDWSV
jgi:hypothetical protein